MKEKRDLGMVWAGLAALALPYALGFHVAPVRSFYMEWLAAIGWSFWLLHLTLSRRDQGFALRRSKLSGALGLGMLVLVLSAWGEVLWSAQSVAFALLTSLYLGAAALTFQIARHWALDKGMQITFMAALVGAGLICCASGIIQVFCPSLIDGLFVAAPVQLGRAVGNMQQPNHLATLLLWAMVGVIALCRFRLVEASFMAVLLSLFSFVIILSGSRTGWMGAAILCLWLLLDARIPKGKWIAISLPLWMAGIYFFMLWWAAENHGLFYAYARVIESSSDVSSGRIALWRSVWYLFLDNWLWGVGSGNFRVAWDFSLISSRPLGFYGNSHNIFLQWLVELGLFRGGFLVLVVLFFFWSALCVVLSRAEVRAKEAVSDPAPWFVMISLIALHSMLEFPLWYMYFMLPAVFAAGVLCQLIEKKLPDAADAQEIRAENFGVLTVGVVLAGIACCFCLHQYQRLVGFGANEAVWLFSSYDGSISKYVGAEGRAQKIQFLRVSGDPAVMKSLAGDYCSGGEVIKGAFVAARLSDISPDFELNEVCPETVTGALTFRDFLADARR